MLDSDAHRRAEIAYAAGLFDGEGCISVTAYLPRNNNGHARQNCQLFLGMQNYGALEYFQSIVGAGSIRRRHDLWMYSVSGSKAGDVAKLLLPFLRVKREAAALFVEYAATYSRHNAKPLPDDLVVQRQDLSARIQHLMRADAKLFREHTSAELDQLTED